MTLNINNQQDILRALDTDSEFRQAMRKHLLAEDLISLPERFAAFVTEIQVFVREMHVFVGEMQQFIAQQEQFNARHEQFIEEQRLVNARQEQFNARQEQFNARQEQFNARQEQTNARQEQTNEQLGQSIQRITDGIGELRGNVAARVAWDHHQEIAEDLGFTTIIKVLSRSDLTDLAGRNDTTSISRDDLRSFYRADLIMEVAAEDNDNDNHYVAMEASYTADQRDSERVARNVRFLTQFTGQMAHPVIASLHNDREVQQLVDNDAVHWYQINPADLQPN